jgi:hypothetical protein
MYTSDYNIAKSLLCNATHKIVCLIIVTADIKTFTKKEKKLLLKLSVRTIRCTMSEFY